MAEGCIKIARAQGVVGENLLERLEDALEKGDYKHICEELGSAFGFF
jgi:hypothetical protein